MISFSEIKEHLALFTILFILGLFFASRVLLLISFVPLFIYLLGISLSSPKIEAKASQLKKTAEVGENIEMQATGVITGGIGPIIFFEELPEPFELVEGSNYKVVWKGVGTKKFDFSYKARCTKRGHYYFRGVEWEFRPILGLKQLIKGIIGESNELTVHPRIFDSRKARITHKFSFISTPMQGITKLGSISTDFKEVRQYTPGDPFKFINWKATARMSTRIENVLLRNEYEREGKLCLWIFIDAHPSMRLGTTVENAFEYSVEAAINLANLFLNKGFLLGMYVYNDLGESFYPDVGKQQFIKIANRLLKLYSIESKLQTYNIEDLSEAIEKNRKQLDSLSPMVVVITHITQNNIKEIVQGIKKFSAHMRKRYWTKALVINVLPYDLIPQKNTFEEFAAKILEAKSKRLSEQLRVLRVSVLNWNPKKESSRTLLIKHLRLVSQ